MTFTLTEDNACADCGRNAFFQHTVVRLDRVTPSEDASGRKKILVETPVQKAYFCTFCGLYYFHNPATDQFETSGLRHNRFPIG